MIIIVISHAIDEEGVRGVIVENDVKGKEKKNENRLWSNGNPQALRRTWYIILLL